MWYYKPPRQGVVRHGQTDITVLSVRIVPTLFSDQVWAEISFTDENGITVSGWIYWGFGYLAPTTSSHQR